jgi:phospholipid/cholesterol/gamma-HCH transport system substrate-binding protein
MDENPPTSQLPGLNRIGTDYSGTRAEQHLLNAMLAQRTGASPDRYGSLGSLLYGPLVREPAGGGR